MKKTLTSFMCGIVIICLSASVLATEAIPNTSAVLVNGKEITFESYNIDGNNYFKLRDIAYVLNGSDSQFDIGYDVTTDTIYLTSGQPYIVVGGELQKYTMDVTDVVLTSSSIIKDGENIKISAYNINGNNYFKLRDIGKEIDFKVDYDETSKNVLINSSKTLQEEEYEWPPKTAVRPSPDPH